MHSRGSEFEADVALSEELSFCAAYTAMEVEIEDFTDDRAFVGNTLQTVVEVLGAETLAYLPAAPSQSGVEDRKSRHEVARPASPA